MQVFSFSKNDRTATNHGAITAPKDVEFPDLTEPLLADDNNKQRKEPRGDEKYFSTFHYRFIKVSFVLVMVVNKLVDGLAVWAVVLILDKNKTQTMDENVIVRGLLVNSFLWSAVSTLVWIFVFLLTRTRIMMILDTPNHGLRLEPDDLFDSACLWIWISSELLLVSLQRGLWFTLLSLFARMLASLSFLRVAVGTCKNDPTKTSLVGEQDLHASITFLEFPAPPGYPPTICTVVLV